MEQDISTIMLSGFSTTFEGKLVGPTGVPMDTESFLAGLKIISNANFTAPAPYASESVVAGAQLPYNVKVQKYGQAIVNKLGQIVLNC